MLEIIIWDENSCRLQESAAALQLALRKEGLQARVILNSEPPLLARMGFIGATPVVEIQGYNWRHKDQQAITSEQFAQLFKLSLDKNSCSFQGTKENI